VRTPPTTEQLRAAFEAFAWPAAWSFDAAMSDPLRAGLVCARACQMRAREYERSHTRAWAAVRRIDPATGRFSTERVQADWDDNNPVLDLR
jgi:hypothetical protein